MKMQFESHLTRNLLLKKDTGEYYPNNGLFVCFIATIIFINKEGKNVKWVEVESKPFAVKDFTPEMWQDFDLRVNADAFNLLENAKTVEQAPARVCL